jgi:tetratricopeptide (TPR) repeat protein
MSVLGIGFVPQFLLLALSTPSELAQYDSASRLLDQGRCAEAREITLQLVRKTTGSAELALFRTFALEAHGEAELCLSRTREAELAFREVLAVRREILPARHADTARAMANLAAALGRRRQPYEAEELLREALAIWRLRSPPDTVSIAAAQNLLATLHQQLEDPGGARRELDKAWNSLGDGAPAALRATLAHNRAVLDCHDGRAADSARWFALSLELAGAAWDETHPRFIAMLRNYAAALRAARRKPEARAIEGRARALEKTLAAERVR